MDGLFLLLPEYIDVEGVAKFKTNQTGTINLIDYLILVEHLRLRWKAIPKPWSLTFETLFTGRTKSIT